MKSKALIIVAIIALIITVAFIGKQSDNYINRVMTIDVSIWTKDTYDFINEKCNCCDSKPMVHPTNVISQISQDKLRDKLMKKLDSTLVFKKSYQVFNIAEKYAVGSHYKAYIWLDNEKPLHYYSYYATDNDFKIENIDLDDPLKSGYEKFFSESQIEESYCDVDTTMDVLRGSFFHTKFILKDEKLEPDMQEVILY